MNEKIAIIDTDSIIHSAFYGNKVMDEYTGEPKKEDGKFVIIPKTKKQIEESFDGIFKHIFEEGQFTHYIAFVKGNNTIGDRLLINPDYKQQRTKVVNEEWEPTCQYAMERWGCIEINDMEVDDAVRIANINIPNSHIVAIDKDLLWLEGTNFNWRKNEWITVSKEEELKYLCRSMIIGDGVDNVHGLKGKGEKWCDKMGIEDLEDVLQAYCFHYNDDYKVAVTEFNKNFQCLYILKEKEGFNVPKPIEITIKTGENAINEEEITPSRSSARKI